MIKFDALQFEPPIKQAALAGYSDAPMRLVSRRHGAPYALDEVHLDKLVLQPGKLREQILEIDPVDRPIGGQLMGSEPTQFAAAAAAMAEAGYDVIDINFGCPVKKVLGRCRGGFLLSTPSIAIDIVRSVREAVPAKIPVTVKMRRGLDDAPESERNFFEILDAAFELGVAAITVHGRTVRQRYVGPSDWSFLKRVKAHVGDRVILGSGDLFNAHNVVRMLRETGVDGASIARGCIGNPWIFAQVAALLRGDPITLPSVPEQGDTIRVHCELSLKHHGAALAARLMRKFGIKYSELHPAYVDVRNAFVRCQTIDDWLRVIDQWYDPAHAWPPPREKTSPDNLVANGASARASGALELD